MVQVRQQILNEHGQLDKQRWLQSLLETVALSTEEQNTLLQAAQQAELWHKSGLHSLQLSVSSLSVDAYTDNDLQHQSRTNLDSLLVGLEMAQILATLHLDADSLVAAVLYRSIRDEHERLHEVETLFGERVARLIQGVLRMAAIDTLRKQGKNRVFGQNAAEQIENLRKMLVGIIDDVRVALIKIAERTCALRALKQADETRRRHVAREVMDIYAPLAHRLGLGHIKWELEDLAFRYLEPEAYKQIASLLDEKRVARQAFIEQVILALQQELSALGITPAITGRAKHIYSIWRKMRQKNIGFSQVYDVRAVRVLVTTVHECYMALGVVHGLWRRIPNEFDDYIANPKENGYRSLHTAVIGPEGKVMEIQIRTHWMHEEAEFGVCAHWQYKKEEGDAPAPPTVQPADQTSLEFEEKVEWLRQVLAWHEETGGDSSLIDELRSDVIHQKIYVFTPEGDVVELQQHATPLDFAYHVHTGLGHRCRGARVNGRVVALNHELQNSDQVEIIAGKHEVPNREWLEEGLGYVHTARALAKVQQWFKQQAREQNIIDGSMRLDRELKRLDLRDIDLDAVIEQLHLKSVEDLYAGLGSSEIEMRQVLKIAQQTEGVFSSRQQLSFEDLVHAAEPLVEHNIAGVGNLPVVMAPCCSPGNADVIAGLIQANQTVMIHRHDCEEYLQLSSEHPENNLQVSWLHRNRQPSYLIDIEVEAYERVGLLRDISELFDAEQVNIAKLHSEASRLHNTVTMFFSIEITSLQNLSVLLTKIMRIPNVYMAQRRR